MKKLLFVINDVNSFYNHRAPLIEKISENFDCSEVYVLLPMGPSLKAEVESRFPKWTFIDWDLNRGSVDPFSALKSIIQLAAAIRIRKPDVVHSFTIKPVIFAAFVFKFLSVPVKVATITGVGSVFIEGNRGLKVRLLLPLVSFLYKVLMGSYDTIIFQNSADMSYFLKNDFVTKKQVQLIRGSGVDFGKFSAGARDSAHEKLVLFPARLLRDKGLVELIEAFKLFSEAHSSYRLVICGGIDSHNPSSLNEKELAELLGDSKNIDWVGEQKSMRDWYAKASVVCLPSYREGLSKALLEAVASECFLVTTDVPGCRELAGKFGVLVEAGSATSLYEGFVQMHKLKDDWKSLSLANKKRIQDEFSIQSVSARYAECYNTNIKA